MKEKIENAAYAIACQMIDWGMIESVPEAEQIEYEIGEILKKYFN
jgi:hypothetical protein